MKKLQHGDTSWFVHDRFGMFIHWGLYSMPARHEWIRNYEEISNEDYQKYFDHFDPDLFQPEIWAEKAAAAGMKYVVFTAKHHEGFCMWDSKYTDYKATNTAAARDLLREVIDAFRARGIRIGIYYSLIDWHHEDFTIDQHHPLRNRPKAEIAKLNQGRDMKRYALYMRNQVTELLSNYGKIDILWFDFSYPGENGKGHEDWESEKLLKLIRSLQPGVIIDNRLDLPGSGDVFTPEQYTPDAQPTDEKHQPIVWEGCQTLSGAWGYHRDEMTWKSVEQCITMLINHVSLNGNLLMNVGPTSRGYLDHRAIDALDGFAEWMKYHNRAIYGCGAAPDEFQAPKDCRYTWNPVTRRLYVHFFCWPFKHIHLHNLAGKVRYAQFLNDGSEVQIRVAENAYNHAMNSCTPDGAITLELPVIKPHATIPVVELFLA